MKYSFFIIIAVTVIACTSKRSEVQQTGMEGKPMPAFMLQLPDSTSYISTTAIKTQKPIALFYFSPYCPYCRAQTAEIIEDMEKLKDIQFCFITPQPYAHMKKFFDEYQLGKYPNIITGVDTARFVREYFEIPGVPYMAVYNKNKILNKAFLGKVYSSQIKKAAEL